MPDAQSESPFDLTGRVALVTGAGRGIGRSIALGLAAAGADVAVSARSPDQLDGVCDEMRALGRQALALPADLADLEPRLVSWTSCSTTRAPDSVSPCWTSHRPTGTTWRT